MRQRYAPLGLLALQPQAFGMMFDVHTPDAPIQQDGVALLTVRGPLMHHHSWCFDSYDDIKCRLIAAVEMRPKAIVMCIDSPGGLVSGCFDTVREIRAIVEKAKVPLYAFVDGSATSAAYALACAASRIYVPETGVVGSIGVLDTLVDATKQAEMFGLQVKLVASGARKTDGHPDMQISDDALRVAQDRVNSLAEIFFNLVAEARPKVSVDQLRALEAGLVHGADAVEAGLADEVATLDQLLAMVASGTVGERTMASELEEAIEKLRSAAESDNEEEAAKARKMLAALEDEDDSAEDDSEEETAEGDDLPVDDSAEEEEDEDGPVASVLAGTPEALAAKVQRLEAKLARREEREERERLLASRPDLAPEVVAWLRNEKISVVRKAVKTLPKGVNRRRNPVTEAAAGTPPVTRGEGQGDGRGSRLPPEEKAALDARMGLIETVAGVVQQGNKLVLGCPIPKTK